MTPEELRAIRLDLQLTQADFADLLGLTRGHVTKLEAGDCRITKRTQTQVEAIARKK